MKPHFILTCLAVLATASLSAYGGSAWAASSGNITVNGKVYDTKVENGQRSVRIGDFWYVCYDKNCEALVGRVLKRAKRRSEGGRDWEDDNRGD